MLGKLLKMAANCIKKSDILEHSKNLQYYPPACQIIEVFNSREYQPNTAINELADI
jgi:hypothetical protein